MPAAMSVTVAMPVTLVIVITMLIPAVMAAVVVPVLAVFVFVAVADDHLVVPTAVTCIPNPINIIMYPRARLIDNHLITVIYIVIAIAVRQIRLTNPNTIVQINILVCRYIKINAYIRHVIVIGMVITYRTPFGLYTYVYA